MRYQFLNMLCNNNLCYATITCAKTLTCKTLNVSDCSILLRIARSIKSRLSPSDCPIRYINMDTCKDQDILSSEVCDTRLYK